MLHDGWRAACGGVGGQLAGGCTGRAGHRSAVGSGEHDGTDGAGGRDDQQPERQCCAYAVELRVELHDRVVAAVDA